MAKFMNVNSAEDFGAAFAAAFPTGRYFETEEDFNAETQSAIAEAVASVTAELTEAHKRDADALRAERDKAIAQNATADYTAYSKYPDLIELLKAAKLRPGALPSLCALRVWSGITTAKAIAADIGNTPVLGKKGGVASTAKIVTSSLQKLERSLIAANTGVAIKVTSIRGSEGDSSIRKIRFAPIVELGDDTTDDEEVETAEVETVSEVVGGEKVEA